MYLGEPTIYGSYAIGKQYMLPYSPLPERHWDGHLTGSTGAESPWAASEVI